MTRRYGKLGPALKRAGYDVIPVKAGDKAPAISAWQHVLSLEQTLKYAANGHANNSVGLLASRFPGVDIDVTDPACADAIAAHAQRELGPAPVRYGGVSPKRLLMYTTAKPFAKLKVFLSGPDGDRGPDGKQYAVEVLGAGQQYVIYGQHPSGPDYNWPGNDGPETTDLWDLTSVELADVQRFLLKLPECLPEGWRVVSGSGSSGEASVSQGAGAAVSTLTAFENYRGPLDGWSLERTIDELLVHLDPDMEHDEWVKVGMALHHQGEGDHEWLTAWEDWSSGGTKFAEGVCETRWKSFSQQHTGGNGALTLASLLAQTKEQRGAAMDRKRDVLMAEIRAEIVACTDSGHLQKEVAVKISNTLELSDVQREQLAIMIQAKSKDLGAKLQIKTVRAWVHSRAPRDNSSMPDWARGWVYITEGDKFFNTANKHQVSSQGFCAMFNRNMPPNQNGARFRADRYCTDQCGMLVVSHKGYVPVSGPIFEMFGLKWVNTYRPDSVPDVPDDFTVEDSKAIEAVRRHLTAYLAEPRERELLLSWIAHNVKYPGVKIRWAPYVHGVPGDGKTFFSVLLAMAMGGQNVRMLNGSTLESNFTDWAAGHAVVCIEEMKQQGHNRHDIMNKIKPVITNDSIEIHPKGLASYTAPNFSNYIIFSNYLDGAPIDESDRRYMFLSSQLTTDQVKAMTEEDYFKTLFEAIQHHPGAIRKWLLGYELHPEFNANGRAPDTVIKFTVIEMSKGPVELAAQTIIEENETPGVTQDVISSVHLMRAVSSLDYKMPATSQVNSLLTRLGFYFAIPKPKKWDGKPCRIWVRNGIKLSEIEMIKRLDDSKFQSFLR